MAVWDDPDAAKAVFWVERHGRIHEHLDAAFEALKAAGEIYPDTASWQKFSRYSYTDPENPGTLELGEAQAESAVYVLENPDSDWRSAKYAVYRSLREMALLDAAEVARFQAAERLGYDKPHLLPSAELTEILTSQRRAGTATAGAEFVATTQIDIPSNPWLNLNDLLRAALRGVDRDVRDRASKVAIEYVDVLTRSPARISLRGLDDKVTVHVEPDGRSATLQFAFHIRRGSPEFRR